MAMIQVHRSQYFLVRSTVTVYWRCIVTRNPTDFSYPTCI